MKEYDIHKRIFNFVILVLRSIKSNSPTLESKIIVNQLIRSATSVGANDQEADGASSKKDFVHCYTIVRKELKETHYWLSILSELNKKQKEELKVVLNENEELIKIVGSIIGKTIKKTIS